LGGVWRSELGKQAQVEYAIINVTARRECNETYHKAMTHPPDVKGTSVERAQTPSGPILAPTMTDAELRITPKMMRESSIIFIIVCLLQYER
jgi:hypothetical protein